MQIDWRERAGGHQLTLSKGDTTGILAAIYYVPLEKQFRVYLMQHDHSLFLAQYHALDDAKRAAEQAMVAYVQEELDALRLFVLGRLS